jgi:chromosome segregation ATPase
VLKTRRTEKKARRNSGGIRSDGSAQVIARAAPSGNGRNGARESQNRDDRLARITAEIEAHEADIARIDAAFAAAGYFEKTPGEQIKAAQARRAQLQQTVERLLEEWERLEQESEAAV